MKATLEFSLPEESYQLKRAIQGPDLCAALSDLDNQLRNWLKHGHSFASSTEALEATRGFLSQVLTDKDINIYE